MLWSRALRQLEGIAERWEEISERIEPKTREEMQRLLAEASAASGTALLELINRIMQLGLNSDARDIFREIGRSSREILEAERRIGGGEAPEPPPDVPRSPAVPPAAASKAATINDVKRAVESLLESVADFGNENAAPLKVPDAARKEFDAKHKRNLNAWVSDGKPVVGRAFELKLNIGAPKREAVASAEFIDFESNISNSITLLVSLASKHCEIEPRWRELTLPVAGDSEIIVFHVIAGKSGKHDFSIRVYLSTQMIPLQSLGFVMEVGAAEATEMGALG